MFRPLARWLTRLAGWLAPPGYRGTGANFGFPYAGRLLSPAPGQLLAELTNTAWTCAGLNAAVCAGFPPKLYVRTRSTEPKPRCLTRTLRPDEDARLRSLLGPQSTGERIELVHEHPLLDLLASINPNHNQFDLWELTTLSLETHGVAYWLLEFGPLGTPVRIWPLPAHQVTPERGPDSNRLVDAWIYRPGGREQRLDPADVIAFRYPDLRDPYLGGMSPLRACFDQVRLAAELSAFKQAKFRNHAIPDAIISPEQVIGEEERDRLEHRWNARLRQGGAGRVIVAESALRVQMLEHSMGDLAALADLRATKEDIANAFSVPLAFLTSQTNLANLQAAEQQHLSQAIRPRLRRRDEKLNEQLVPFFDPTGRLFLASDEPAPGNRELFLKERDLYLRHGVLTVDEVRAELGLPPRGRSDQRS